MARLEVTKVDTMARRYDDIINLPHWEPRTHRRMPEADRAGQFAPFAALTGYDDMIAETSRQASSAAESEFDSFAVKR